jgi:hypothetical protein
MSSTIALRTFQARLHGPIPLRRMAVFTTVVTVIVVLGFFIDETTQAFRLPADSDAVAATSFAPRRELSPEWQWKGKTVNHDKLYGNSQPGEKPDWVRNGWTTKKYGPR